MQIVKYSKFFLIFSAIVLVPGVISLIVNGLNLSIDFKGGSFIEYKITNPTITRDGALIAIKESYESKGVSVQEIKPKGDASLTLKIKEISVEKNEEVKTAIAEKVSGVELQVFETVGPSVGAETAMNSLLAVGVASLGILLYIAFAFRNVPKPYSSFRFGMSAIVAMLHDALMVVGIFSLLGKVLNLEVGKYTQEVPIYSSIRYKGKLLHQHAQNKNFVIDTMPLKNGEIYKIKLMEIRKRRTHSVINELITKIEGVRVGEFRQTRIIRNWKNFIKNTQNILIPIIKIEVQISRGLYVRSLSQDICKKLNTLGFVSSLVRTKNGKYNRQNCKEL